MKSNQTMKAALYFNLDDPFGELALKVALNAQDLRDALVSLEEEMRSLIKYDTVPDIREHIDHGPNSEPIDFYKEITAHWRKRLNEILGER